MPDLVDIRVRLETALRALESALEHLPPESLRGEDMAFYDDLGDQIVYAQEQVSYARDFCVANQR